MEISKEKKYDPFVEWAFETLKDEKLHLKRMEIIKANYNVDFASILRTTPFPVPEKLTHFYGLVVNAERIMKRDGA